MPTPSPAEHNRQVVLAFYRLALVGRRPQEAFGRFMAAEFVEHKPDVARPTREGAAAFLAELIRELPLATWEVVRTVADDEQVCVHARFVPAPGAPAYAIADIFRLQGGLIVEHWDVVAGPPAAAVNPHPRF